MSRVKNIFDKGCEAFLFLSGVILLSAAFIRLMVAHGDSQVLTMPDPVLGIPVHDAALYAGIVELVVSLVCLFGQNIGARMILLIWLMTIWVVYRAGAVYLKASLHCTCLGMPTNPLRIPNHLLERMSEVLPVYMLAGACIFIVGIVIFMPKQRRQSYLKIACPGCGGHIEIPPEGIGLKITCPHCSGGIRLQNIVKIA